jgi:hypothetical protein
MAESPHRIVRAWLESLTTGVVELDRDWNAKVPPRFTLGAQCPSPAGLSADTGLMAACSYRYFVNGVGEMVFALTPEHGSAIDPTRDTLYVAGDFNGWQEAVGNEAWRLRPEELDGEHVLMWRGAAARFLKPAGQRFKFVTGEHHWLSLPDNVPNGVRDREGNLNRVIDPARTGRHLWRFSLAQPLDLAEALTVAWAGTSEATAEVGVPLVPGVFFHELKTDLPLGALVRGDETVFRLFAPRARGSPFLCATH